VPARASEVGGARPTSPQPAAPSDGSARDGLAGTDVANAPAEESQPAGAAPTDAPTPPAASGTGAETAQAAQPGGERAGPLDVERATLSDALRQVTPGNSAYEATQTLLKAWKVKPLTPREAASAALDLPAIARARGLEYLSLYGNMNLLRVLDLPAILEIAPEDGSPPRFVTVEQLDDNRANVMIGRTTTDVAPAVLAEAWFGRAHLFWRDFDRLGPMLAVGSSSTAVRRLHELLRAASAYDGTGSSLFAPETEQAVVQFQRARRLFADGKVGPLTMIALYQKVDADRLPHLAAVPAAAEGGGQGAGGPLGEQG
jgi:Putative peptidoglycan binding domain